MRHKRGFILVTVLLIGMIIATLLLTQHSNVLMHFKVSAKTSDYIRMGLLEESAAQNLAYLFDQNLYAMQKAAANGDDKDSVNEFLDNADLEAIALYSNPNGLGQVELLNPLVYSGLNRGDQDKIGNHPEEYEDNSIYNMDSAKWAHSFLGKNTVPPASALLVLRTTLGGYTRRGVILVGRPFVSVNNIPGVFAATSFEVGGETSISTVEEDEEGSLLRSGGRLLIKGLKQTNLLGSTSWYDRLKRFGSGRFNLNGGVVSVKDSYDARDVREDLAGAQAIVSEYNKEKDDIKGFDLEDELASAARGKKGYLRKDLSFLNSNPVETVVQGGKYFFSGGGDTVRVPGDLVLEDDAVIVIDGTLQVEGAVRGKGSILVSENATFKGNVDFASGVDQSVAIATQGDLNIAGYDLDLNDYNLANRGQAIRRTVNNIRGRLNNIISVLNEAQATGDTLDINSLDLELKTIVMYEANPLNRRINLGDDTDPLVESSEDGRFAEFFNQVEGELGGTESGDIYLGKLKILRDLINDDNGMNSVSNPAIDQPGDDKFSDSKKDVARDASVADEAFVEAQNIFAGLESSNIDTISDNDWNSYDATLQTTLWLEKPEVCPETPSFFRDLTDNQGIFDATDMTYGGFKNRLLQKAFYRAVELFNELEFQDPVSARFQGVIYSEGDIRIRNRISVKGSVVANPKDYDSSRGKVIFEAGGMVSSLKSQTNSLVQMRGSRSEILLKIE